MSGTALESPIAVWAVDTMGNVRFLHFRIRTDDSRFFLVDSRGGA